MKLDNQVLIYALTSLFLVFVVGKVLGILLKGVSDKFFLFGSKKKSHDIDEMIEQKKATFRSAHGSNATPELKRESEKEKAQKSLNKYIKFNEKNPSKGIQKAIDFLNSLQWGEGPEFQNIISDIQAWTGSEIQTTQLIKSIRTIDHLGVPCSLHRNNLPEFDELKDLIILFTGIKILENQCSIRAGEFLELLAKKWKTSEDKVALSYEAFLHARTGMSERDLYVRILGPSAEQKSTLPRLGENKIQAATLSLLYKAGKKEFSNKESLLHNIKCYLEIIEMLTPLPSMNSKSDEETALKIFGLRKPFSQDEVKGQYKKLAILKHPDKVSAKKLPDFLIKTANENFIKIQQAYDILKNKKAS